MKSNNKTTRIEKNIEKLIRNEITVSLSAPQAPLAAHVSHIGGRPELPDGFEWPYYEGEGFDGVTADRPLSFIAQFNMSELSAYDKDGVLPKTGMLCFFYELISQKWGFDPADKGCSRVYYFEDIDSLTVTELPSALDEECVLPEMAVSFGYVNNLPDWAELDECGGDEAFELMTAAGWSWEQYDELAAAMGCAADDSGDYSKLLGYPDIIQNPMELECERSTRGIYTGNAEYKKTLTQQDKEAIAEATKDWTLLFQLNSFESGDYALDFGDTGSIYFWIRKRDLAEKRFEDCWLVLQCY